MPLMCTCVARLGSRYSIILDPIRHQVHYGALGLMSQSVGELVIQLDDGHGRVCTLPLASDTRNIFCIDQHLTMTSVRYEAQCLEVGLSLDVKITAPFWPQDEKTSLVPAYVFDFRVKYLPALRWQGPPEGVLRKGHLRFGIRLPGAAIKSVGNMVQLKYPVKAPDGNKAGEFGEIDVLPYGKRRSKLTGTATDLVVPLEGKWKSRHGLLEIAYDVDDYRKELKTSVALVGYCGDALFERFGAALPFKYTKYWKTPLAVARFVQKNHRALVRKSERFDALFLNSALPPAAQDLSALGFQSYLMCTLWAAGDIPGRDLKPTGAKDWFSVWEGSCRFNSTVDVTYNEAPFYFACWPQLMELLFDEWDQHVNDAATEQTRLAHLSGGNDAHDRKDESFPGGVMEHDMGSGWTANGQSYHHAMPVEENANYLLLLHAHARWWGRPSLYRRHKKACRLLTEYLLWSDSTGNGFPDRGTANTIDDANPAVQYGRGNVYLGIKRLAALHAAARIFEHLGDAGFAGRCRREVNRAMKTLRKGWLGDHYPVVLDKSTKGLCDAWTNNPLPYSTLPGWDAYSLYTTNGLLYLMMIDDVPKGLDMEKLKIDIATTIEKSMTPYGCSHSSHDDAMVWISMNIWRDAAGAYLGKNLLHLSERYWNQQVFANGAGSEKPNCFTETSFRNNLVWYPRGAAAFALMFAGPGLVMDRTRKITKLHPLSDGNWPLLPLMNWKSGSAQAKVGR